jgi:amino acid transporter
MSDPESVSHHDIEKQITPEKSSENSPPSYDKAEDDRRGSTESVHEGFFGAFKLKSFQRNPNARVVTEATDNEGRPLKDQPPAEPALKMKLKQRHLQMIAIGGSIGVSLSLRSDIFSATDLSKVLVFSLVLDLLLLPVGLHP